MVGAGRSRVMPQPRMSVVVASSNARPSVRDCLAVLVDHRRGDDVEILVVDNSHDGSAEIVKDDFPDVQLIAAPASALIPELWSLGVRKSRGRTVAIPPAHFVPDRNWVDAVLEARESAVAGVGGAIENSESAGPCGA